MLLYKLKKQQSSKISGKGDLANLMAVKQTRKFAII
jgi:hypothetical protein